MPRPLPAPRGKLGPALLQRINELGITFKDVSDTTDRSINHVRNVVLGVSCPSDEMLERISELLKLDLERLKDLRAEDMLLQSPFGQRLQSARLEIPKSLLDLAPVWDNLDDVDRRRAAAVIQALADTAAREKKQSNG